MPRHTADHRIFALLAIAFALEASSAANAMDGQDELVPPTGRLPAIHLSPHTLAPADANIGRVIAPVGVSTLDGVRWTLFDTPARRGTIVVVRDPRCPVSRRYGPRIRSLAQQFLRQGYEFVFIYPTTDLLDEHRLLDRRSLGVAGTYIERGSFALAGSLGVRSTGDVFVLDQSHRLRYRGAIDDQYGVGFTRDFPTRNYLRDAIESLVQGRPVDTSATLAPGCHIDADPALDGIAHPPAFDRLPA